MQNTFQPGQTASGVAASLGHTPAQFLSYNPNLAAAGHPNDYKGLTGLVQVGQPYNIGPTNSQLSTSSAASRNNDIQNDVALQNAKTSIAPPVAPDGTTPTPPAASDTTDPFIQNLESMNQNSDAMEKSLLATTKAAYQNQMNTVNQSYNKYKAGLESLGIEHNAAQSTPELLAGQIQTVANQQAQKIGDLHNKMLDAISKADLAQRNNNFKTKNEEITRYNQLKTEKRQAIIDARDAITFGNKEAIANAPSMYQEFKTKSPTDQEAFINQKAQELGTTHDVIQSALINEQQKESVASTTAFEKDLTIQRLQNEIATQGTGKPLTPSNVKSLNAQNPLISLSYGDTNEDAIAAVQNAKTATSQLQTDFTDPTNIGPQGYFTFDYIKTIIPLIPAGIDKIKLLTALYNGGKLTPKLDREENYKGYGLTAAEAKTIMGK